MTGCLKSEAPTKSTQAEQHTTLQTVTIASAGSDADIWRHIATLPETAEESLKLEVKNFSDYVSLNTAVAKNDPVFQVAALYHPDAMKQFIQEKFSVTKVDVNKTISYLSESK